MKFIWLPEAGEDIERLFEFLLARNPRAASRAVRTVLTGSERLLEHPKLGRLLEDDSHRRELYLPFGAGAYVLRYRLHYDTIVIIRVWRSKEVRDSR